MANGALVAIVDDDDSVRESLPDLIRTFGFTAIGFASGEDFLKSSSIALTGCLVLDIAMPGMTGPQLQRELARRDIDIPIVFITANGNGVVRQKMLDAGAVECLAKPFCPDDLCRTLKMALAGK